LVLLTLLAGLACAPSQDEPETEASLAPSEIPERELERARQAAAAMGSRLMGTLVEELREGGPVQAVRVCSDVAPSIAKEQSSDGLTIRRVSLRFRNPFGEPDAYERGVLEAWASAHEPGMMPEESAEVVTLDGREQLRYMKPIMVMTPCLKCHGDPEGMSPELKALLVERYPDDRATGYRDGDLRGAFSVTADLRP
jgi:hypothetical protein